MKKIYSIISLLGLTIALLSSCQGDAVSSLTGEYAIPQDITLTTVATQSDAVNANKTARYFNLKLTGDNNKTLNVQFVCANTWYLEARTYTMASSSGATIGNFVSDNTNYSDGSTSATISDGSITVTKSDSTYSINGVFIMSDKSVIRTHFNGTIIYAKPQPEKLTQILSANATVGTGYTTIELKMGTNGLMMSSSPYGPNVTGSGDYANIDLICSNSTLAAGTYTPCENTSVAIGDFTEGYTMTFGTFSLPMGSCWYTLSNGTTTSTSYLTTGSINISINNGIYTITIDSGSTYAQYIGAITF